MMSSNLVITFEMPSIIMRPSQSFNFHSSEIHFCKIVEHIFKIFSKGRFPRRFENYADILYRIMTGSYAGSYQLFLPIGSYVGFYQLCLSDILSDTILRKILAIATLLPDRILIITGSYIRSCQPPSIM